jgi:hypothetical protein
MPWYKRLFAMPNLAYTMGALVVMFSGVIGLLVYQNQMAERSTQLSRANSIAPTTEQPAIEDRTQYSTNSMSNSAGNAASSSPIESVTKSGVEVGSSGTGTSAANSSISNPAAAAPPTVSQEEKPADLVAGAPANEPTAPAKQPALAAPQTAAKEKDAEDRRELDDKKSAAKTEANRIARNDELSKMDVQNQSNNTRDLSPGSNSAKLRAVGPRQVQAQTQNQVTIDGVDSAAGRAVSNLKTAGGKKFEYRDGVWYDTAYTGQNKKDVKRGTEKFLRLDAGLRSIADQIGGTVVVVWNGQAYKIK